MVADSETRGFYTSTVGQVIGERLNWVELLELTGWLGYIQINLIVCRIASVFLQEFRIRWHFYQLIGFSIAPFVVDLHDYGNSCSWSVNVSSNLGEHES